MYDDGPLRAARAQTNSAKSQARNSVSPQQSVSNLLGSAASFGQGLVGQIGNGIKQAAEDVFSSGAGGFMSLLRGKGIPFDGLFNGGSGFSSASWIRSDDDDWRVKLSMPSGMSLDGILQAKLNATNGMIFPYTPQIIISHSASYSQIKPTHSNYPFPIYQNSQPDNLQLVGDFFVESADEALYWVACIHYLRSVTKMAYGNTSNAGSPPPVVSLNGYGDYVFKNVPVVVVQFNVDLPGDVDYIHEPNTNTWVPTRSTVTVQLMPTYSRRAVQSFSLDTFVKGGYAKGPGGFV